MSMLLFHEHVGSYEKTNICPQEYWMKRYLNQSIENIVDFYFENLPDKF